MVFKDQAGGYYLVPRETLEQGRVPAERTAELERLIAEQPDDVHGHAAQFGVLVVCALLGTLVGEIIGPSLPLDRRVMDSGGERERLWTGSKF